MNDQTTGLAEPQPRTVADLLDRIDRERGQLEQLIDNMTDAAFVATSGGWSAKDHAAHVAAWERRLLAEIQGDHAAARFGLAEDTSDTDDLNEMLLDRHQDDPPATVRAEFHAAGQALRSTFARMTDDDLIRPVRPDDPAVATLVDLIGYDTFKHYPDHTATITGNL